MPGCAMKDCKNSSRQGVKMNTLPRNLIKREKWITNCEQLGGMKNWPPLDTAALCEYHFPADMWEKPRIDGKKKLKSDAVPTIFGDLVYQAKRKVDEEIVTDIDTQDTQDTVLVETTTDSVTKEVQLFTFLNEKKCELPPNTSETISKNSKLSELVNTAKQITYNTEVSIEDDQQQDSNSAEVSENAILSENSSNGFAEEETSLLSSQNDFQSLDPNTSIWERYQKLEKLYHKSEKLRIAMKKRHIKIYKAFKRKIKKIQDQIVRGSLENLQY